MRRKQKHLRNREIQESLQSLKTKRLHFRKKSPQMKSLEMSDLQTASGETTVHETTDKMLRAMRIHLAKKERQEKKEYLVKNAV